MLVTMRHSLVCVRFQPRTVTVIGHAMRSSYPSLHVSHFGFSSQLCFVPPFPSMLCLGWVTTDHPRCLVISAAAATGMVPFDHSGFYPFAVVVLVACTAVVEWSLVGACLCYQETVCSWWAMAVSPVNQAFSPTSHYDCHLSG